MKTNEEKNKSGGVLVMAVVVLLSFSVLIIGLYKLRDMLGVETVYQNHSKQAFWEAENGLKDAFQRLRFDASFRNSAAGGSTSFNVTNSTEGTSYQVTVTDNGNGNPLITHYGFDVVSVGRKGSMNRRIQQQIETKPGFLSAIMAPNDIIINQNTLVNGPIMVLDNGQLIIDDKIPPGNSEEGDFDLIILSDDASINAKKSGADEGEHYGVVDLPVPDDVPTMPDFSSYYNTAAALPTNPVAVNVGTIDLGGTDHYYNVPSGITVDAITGDGTIVNTGPITISPKSNVGDVDIVADVQIISFGDVNIGQKNDFSGDALVYSEGWIYFGDHSIASASSVLLADGVNAAGDGIEMGGHSQFQGIIFADDGNVTIQQGSNGSETRIEGTVISGDSVDLGQNSEILFNPNFFNSEFFDLSQFFQTEVTATIINDSWEELAPL
jgi:hypothetical protein